MTDRNGSLTVEDPAKRHAVLEQAIAIFGELGLRKADVQMIADRAGVGKGTVYRYFGSKEELFEATTLELLVRLDNHILAAMDGVEGACAKIRAAALAHAGFFAANPKYLELLIQERLEFPSSGPESHHRRHEEMLDRVSRILDEGIASGELRPLDTRQTTLALGCMLFGTAMLAGHVKGVDLEKMTEYAVGVFLRGISDGASD